MRAHVGDQLVVDSDRIGIVVGVPAKDGSPPYIVKWQKDGHIAMVLPDQYSRIVPADEPVRPRPSHPACRISPRRAHLMAPRPAGGERGTTK